MAIKYYGRKEHPTGFIGFRITVAYGDKCSQKYLSTISCFQQSEECKKFYYLKTLARWYEAKWKCESAWYQYQQFVTTTRRNTKPERGVGVTGITAGYFLVDNSRVGWTPGFSVSIPKKPYVRYTFRQYDYSKAWEAAVLRWAQEYEILPADVQKVLDAMPAPDQFKRLRRQMNLEGYDIPVEALEPVFREQRSQLKTKRALSKLNSSPPKGELSDAPSNIQADDVIEWFEAQRARTAS